MPNTSGLRPGEPGESGNPGGSSKKAKARRYVRDFIRQHCDEAVDPKIVAQLAELGIGADDLTYGSLIAMRLVAQAAMGNPKAIDQVLGTEPRELPTGPEAEPSRSYEFLPSPEDQAELEAFLAEEGIIDPGSEPAPPETPEVVTQERAAPEAQPAKAGGQRELGHRHNVVSL